MRTECGGLRGLREYAQRCAESGWNRAERRTEMMRRTERKPLGVPWRDEGERKDEGQAEMKGEGREVANTTQWRVTSCRVLAGGRD